MRCAVIWCDMVWYGLVWCGLVWSGLVWSGLVWCGNCIYRQQGLWKIIDIWTWAITDVMVNAMNKSPVDSWTSLFMCPLSRHRGDSSCSDSPTHSHQALEWPYKRLWKAGSQQLNLLYKQCSCHVVSVAFSVILPCNLRCFILGIKVRVVSFLKVLQLSKASKIKTWMQHSRLGPECTLRSPVHQIHQHLIMKICNQML